MLPRGDLLGLALLVVAGPVEALVEPPWAAVVGRVQVVEATMLLLLRLAVDLVKTVPSSDCA